MASWKFLPLRNETIDKSYNIICYLIATFSAKIVICDKFYLKWNVCEFNISTQMRREKNGRGERDSQVQTNQSQLQSIKLFINNLLNK